MRLWTIHPQYLDTRGLVALWRESLLAQKVLKGETKGYRNHPQLQRFLATSAPLETIALYLHGIHLEAVRRNYKFDSTKIGVLGDNTQLLPATEGQLLYEWQHLLNKLYKRTPSQYINIHNIAYPTTHPIFYIIPGLVAEWEKPTTT